MTDALPGNSCAHKMALPLVDGLRSLETASKAFPKLRAEVEHALAGIETAAWEGAWLSSAEDDERGKVQQAVHRLLKALQ